MVVCTWKTGFAVASCSPVWTPANVARGEILVACRLLDQDVHLLFKVLLVENGCPDLLTGLLVRVRGCNRWINIRGRLLVGIVELKTTKFVLDTLNDYFGNLVQLVLTCIFVFFLLKKLA